MKDKIDLKTGHRYLVRQKHGVCGETKSEIIIAEISPSNEYVKIVLGDGKGTRWLHVCEIGEIIEELPIGVKNHVDIRL